MSHLNSLNSNPSGLPRRRATNVVDYHRTAIEFSKLIAKLRWIGCDDEANALARQLAMVAPKDFAFIAAADTD